MKSGPDLEVSPPPLSCSSALTSSLPHVLTTWPLHLLLALPGCSSPDLPLDSPFIHPASAQMSPLSPLPREAFRNHPIWQNPLLSRSPFYALFSIIAFVSADILLDMYLFVCLPWLDCKIQEARSLSVIQLSVSLRLRTKPGMWQTLNKYLLNEGRNKYKRWWSVSERVSQAYTKWVSLPRDVGHTGRHRPLRSVLRQSLHLLDTRSDDWHHIFISSGSHLGWKSLNPKSMRL